jgi:hypothetical protein
MKNKYILQVISLALLLGACASTPDESCPPGTLDLPACPPAEAVDDEKINELYRIRTWMPPSKLDIDPIALGSEAEIPINSSQARIIGASIAEAKDSLAAKIWLIENAQHTVDVAYYILGHRVVVWVNLHDFRPEGACK